MTMINDFIEIWVRMIDSPLIVNNKQGFVLTNGWRIFFKNRQISINWEFDIYIDFFFWLININRPDIYVDMDSLVHSIIIFDGILWISFLVNNKGYVFQ